jgi:hypothetical protein
VLVLEALRKGLCEGGIDHDSWDFIAQRQLDNLKAQGLVPSRPDYEAVIQSVEPNVWIRSGHEVWSNATKGMTKAKAREIAAAIVAATHGPCQVSEDTGPRNSWIHVSLGVNTSFVIYYDPEAQPHA